MSAVSPRDDDKSELDNSVDSTARKRFVEMKVVKATSKSAEVRSNHFFFPL